MEETFCEEMYRVVASKSRGSLDRKEKRNV